MTNAHTLCLFLLLFLCQLVCLDCVLLQMQQLMTCHVLFVPGPLLLCLFPIFLFFLILSLFSSLFLRLTALHSYTPHI